MSNWRQRLEIENHPIISEEVDRYLVSLGFYEAKLSPRFLGEGSTFKIEHWDAKCLRFDTKDPRDYENTMRIFINKNECYMEVEYSYRSFCRGYWTDHRVHSIEGVDELLDVVTLQ